MVDGRIVHWSRGAELLYGWTADEAIGRAARDLLKQKNADGTEASAAEPERGEIWNGAFSRAHKDGRELAIAARCVSRCEFDGRAAVIELDDLVERAALAGSTQACQSEAGGGPTRRIVHDFNNLLGIITLNLELARERAAAGGEVREMIEEALDAAWQGSKLTGRLAEVARRQPA
jgi:two-component system cell cycle sensor histidine kinase/response regulator CckA